MNNSILIINILLLISVNGLTIINAAVDVLATNKSSKFPDKFLFGASTAAYQIEGGWNADGKGPSIWDTFTHQHPEKIVDKSNGDIGPDSYHRFDEDLKLIKELGLNFYRFSISWPRIMPSGENSTLNQAGIDYYNDVINKLLANNVEPMVTMYHYDLPEKLNDIGGFTNPLFILYFEKYAEALFEHFGDRVKYWVTFNEPMDYCMLGYGEGFYPPMIKSGGVADYLCFDHTLKAHAKAYRLYREKYYKKFGEVGRIGITISSRFYYAKDRDEQLVDRGMDFMLGWLAHPLFSSEGGYPRLLVEEIGNNSRAEGRAWSRLPEMTAEWKDYISGAGDFLGINYYTSRYIEYADPPIGNNPSLSRDSRIRAVVDPAWKHAKSAWLYSVPCGLESLLEYVKEKYNNVEVIITENGYSDDGQLDDDDRVQYLKDHLDAVLGAISHGCNVIGYTVWSLIDNFEWLAGYTERFGIYYVNMTSPSRERVAKKSAKFYADVIKMHGLPSN